NPTVLCIECDTVRISETGGVALKQAKRRVIFIGVLLEHDHGAVVLKGQKHLLRGFVNGYAKRSVRRVKFPRRRCIAFGGAVKDNEAIDSVVVDREDAA